MRYNRVTVAGEPVVVGVAGRGGGGGSGAYRARTYETVVVDAPFYRARTLHTHTLVQHVIISFRCKKVATAVVVVVWRCSPFRIPDSRWYGRYADSDESNAKRAHEPNGKFKKNYLKI